MELVIASRNAKKIEEIKRITEALSITTLSLMDFSGCPEVEEDEETFEGNAAKKALTVARHTGRHALADDSGLEVEALNGAPGVYSARYAGVTDKTADAENNEKLLRELRDIPEKNRRARFICCMALASPEGIIRTFRGEINGHISQEPHGTLGFGYDPLFIPSGHTRTFGEMQAGEKDKFSHRGQALKKLADFLSGWDA